MVANSDCRKTEGRTVRKVRGRDDPILQVRLDISNECWYGQTGQNGEDDEPVKLGLQINFKLRLSDLSQSVFLNPLDAFLY